jgi:hypothetical protein
MMTTNDFIQLQNINGAVALSLPKATQISPQSSEINVISLHLRLRPLTKAAGTNGGVYKML